MSTKHTPGPWLFSHRTVIEKPVRISEHFAVAPTFGPSIAFLPQGAIDVQRANARLIASAPELLVALQAVEQAQRDGAYEKAFGAVRAAIAKATEAT